jgi:YfiH family protein
MEQQQLFWMKRTQSRQQTASVLARMRRSRRAKAWCAPFRWRRDGSVVGAAHAGWRGLAGGVLEGTVRAMNKPAGELVAWLGPAIGPGNFEVGDDVREAFERAAAPADRAATERAFSRKPAGKWLCDLYALARLRLATLGLTQVNGGGRCTVAEKEEFFSFRRDGQTGRMAALIWLQPRAA